MSKADDIFKQALRAREDMDRLLMGGLAPPDVEEPTDDDGFPYPHLDPEDDPNITMPDSVIVVDWRSYDDNPPF